MDRQDKERREEFKRHEMEKEHKRKEHLKELDDKARKEEELKFEQLQQKHLNASKNIHHPVSVFKTFTGLGALLMIQTYSFSNLQKFVRHSGI